MKTYFTDPELKVIQFEAKDVLTTSGETDEPPSPQDPNELDIT